jgi:TonB-linked SusC/RagA family outer membrane protein
MKKRLQSYEIPLRKFNIDLKMKLTFLFILITTFAIHADPTYSQGTKISIHMEHVTIFEVFDEIESSTEFKFIFKTKDVDLQREVSVNVEKEEISNILESLFPEKNVSIEILDRKILIKKKKDFSLSIIEMQSNKKEMQYAVNGSVKDGSGTPLLGANILEKGTSNGVTTDFDGNFSITVPNEDAILVVSYVGFETKEVPLNGQTDINITLTESAAALDEVVVVGYGTQKKVNLTGAVSSIQSKDIQNRPITSSSQALQGIQGVYVNQVGGQPGNDEATIRIRGVGTLNNNNPLVLVNGIEFSINDLNPNDIESITVLKDAASAAIYGSRAANGVVLVTTKKGSSQNQISYSGSAGVQEVISLPRVVKDPIRWFQLYSQAQRNFGTNENSLVFSQPFIDEYREGMIKDPDTYPNNDWYDIMFDTALIQEHNLRFSGGGEKTTYTFSLGLLDQNGVLRGTDSNRYNININLNSELKDYLTVGGTFNYSYKEREEPGVGISEIMQMIFKAQSYHPAKLEDGNYGTVFFDIPGHRRYRNPLALADEGDTDIRNQKLFLNAFAEIKLPFGITYKINGGYTTEDQRSKIFTPQIILYDSKTKKPTEIQAGGNPYVTFGDQQRGVDERDDESFNLTLFNTLNWAKTFEDETELKFLLGTSYENFKDTFFTAANEGYLDNNLFELNAGTTNQLVSGTTTQSRLISYFGRANVVLKSKYLFEANFRYDGSSRFAKGNKWAFFPSLSAGWRLNEEKFLSDVDWLQQLKIRASWGQLGNERIGLFRYLDLISPNQDYIFGNTISPGTAVLVDNDETITWETTTIANLGLDASFLNGKLTGSLEYFVKNTDDVLRPVGIPYQVGALGGPIRNIGKIENKGIEIALGHRNNIGGFSYEVSGSITYIKNKVVNLNGEIILDDYSSDGRGPYNITQEGKPINQFLLYQSDGLFQSQEEIDASAFQGNDTKPGYIKYKDLDNNGVIDINDRRAEGSTVPKYTYSFNINMAYKNFSLNTFWQGVGDVQTYNKHVSGVPFWFGTSLPIGWANDSWTPDNSDASFPLLTRYQDAQGTLFRDSNSWLLNASYLRLKNIQLAYDFNSEFIADWGVKNLKVFLNGQNLLTFSPLKDFDPETDLIGNDFFNYPSTKIYTVGVNLSF